MDAADIIWKMSSDKDPILLKIKEVKEWIIKNRGRFSVDINIKMTDLGIGPDEIVEILNAIEVDLNKDNV